MYTLERAPLVMKVILYEKFLIGDVLDKDLGEVIVQIEDLADHYPVSKWHTLMKRNSEKPTKIEFKLHYVLVRPGVCYQ